MLIGAASLPPAQAQGKRLHIVASFSILADVVQNVTGDAADVETLIPLGTDPHAFEPSAQDVVTLSEADVVFVAGLFFEGGLLDVLREASRTYYEVWGCLPIRSVTFDFEEHAAHGESTPDPPETTASMLCARPITKPSKPFLTWTRWLRREPSAAWTADTMTFGTARSACVGRSGECGSVGADDPRHADRH